MASLLPEAYLSPGSRTHLAYLRPAFNLLEEHAADSPKSGGRRQLTRLGSLLPLLP